MKDFFSSVFNHESVFIFNKKKNTKHFELYKNIIIWNLFGLTIRRKKQEKGMKEKSWHLSITQTVQYITIYILSN